MLDLNPGYPAEAIEVWSTPRGLPLLIRPIVPDDREPLAEFFRGLSPRSSHARFHGGVHELPASLLTRLCGVDYCNDMALVATAFNSGRERIVGEARYGASGHPGHVEFALAIADGAQGRGLGIRLARKLTAYAASRQQRRLFGDVALTNRAMLGLARKAGFRLFQHPADHTLVRIERALQAL